MSSALLPFENHSTDPCASLCPMKAITQLAWRPSNSKDQTNGLSDGPHPVKEQLAVASEDSSLRIYSLDATSIST